MAADLRATIAKLSRLRCTWTAEEVAAITETTLSRTRAYLSTLAHQRVLICRDNNYIAGPKASEWRNKRTENKGPSTYGNSRKYRETRAMWESIMLRDWQVAKSNLQNATQPLTSTEIQPDTSGRSEDQPMHGVSHQPPLTLEETAKLLGVSLNTVRNEIERGKLQAFRVGMRGVRISVEALDAYRTANVISFSKQA